MRKMPCINSLSRSGLSKINRQRAFERDFNDNDITRRIINRIELLRIKYNLYSKIYIYLLVHNVIYVWRVIYVNNEYNLFKIYISLEIYVKFLYLVGNFIFDSYYYI